MVEDEMSQLTCDDGGQFVFGIKSAEEARTDTMEPLGSMKASGSGDWMIRMFKLSPRLLSMVVAFNLENTPCTYETM